MTDAFSGGWDSEARLVDGRWVERRPRRPEVAERLLTETRLMPWLAPRLPLPVPVPHLLSDEPLVVRHELIPGEPLEGLDAPQGKALGGFLRRLHAVHAADATREGAPAPLRVLDERASLVADFRIRVLPLLPRELHRAGVALLDSVVRLPADALVHGDLGPAHVLGRNGELTGVIDFCDAHIGDAAIDLAWALHGTPPAFADALAEAYGVTPEIRRRALLWHRLGPWHEVLHGYRTGQDAFIRSGLEGSRVRLTLPAT
ncbi:phosphotransferase family protein [Streptomyces meridianus]|uniref:Phosphotransferase n=1 Tax=Streptomyces meridianus TaxID=2938945 RepID=A0ABT0X8Q2_9ACTN|nr:phosphotransferase [Streptomyces meridianus]MCM2578903.1 phosphotransferase [Streptomyces meridianus]